MSPAPVPPVDTASREPRAPVSQPTAELSGVLQEYMQVTVRLQETQQRLQAEVERLRTELASKDEELQRRRRLAALGELAAGVAHEVRNPLGAIQLFSGLLKQECRSLGRALDLISKIEAGIQVIDGVVQDTLALAPRTCQLRECSLNSLVQAALDLAAGHLSQRGVSVERRLPDRDARVLADAESFQRVLVNLLMNASDAAPGHPVVVGARLDPGGWVGVTVSDAGPGIAPELLEKIFDPFFTTKPTGTGLGLSIAARVMDAHGGTLTARNRPGGGAEFTVRVRTADAVPTDRNGVALKSSAA